MNPSRALTVSLFVNVALVVVIVAQQLRGAPRAASPRAHDSPAAPAPAAAARDAHHAATAPAAMPHAAPLDFAGAMAELRRVGVPGAIIARVVTEDVARRWTPREAEAERAYLDGRIDTKRLAALRDERAADEDRALRAALADGFLAWDREQTVGNMYLGGHVPAESEKDALYALQKDWLRQLRELELAQRDGRLDDAAADDARQRGEREYKRRLAALVGADRVDGLAPPPDPLAQVRKDFGRLNLTDAQVNELAAAHRQWDEAHGKMAAFLAETQTVDAAYDGDLRALDRARDEKFRRILGDDAFLAWQRAGDDRFRLMQNNAAAWALERPQIDQVYAAIRAYDLTVATLEHQAQVREQGGQPVDWTALDRSLGDYAKQTESALRRYLGDTRYEAMAKQNVFNLRGSALAARDPRARPAPPN